VARRAVGVDLGSRYVKVAECVREGNRARLVRWAVVAIPDASQAARARALAQAMRSAEISARKVICAVARADATVKRLRLPANDRDTMRKMLAFEVQQHVPFPMDEVAWDFDLGEDGAVLLVAARKALLQDVRGVMAQAGLKAAAVSVTSIAAADAYSQAQEEPTDGESSEAVVLIELGAGPVTVNVLRGRTWHLSRPLPITGDDLTHAFAADTACAPHEAQTVRDTRGVAAPPAAAAHVAQWMQTLRAEVERSLLAAAEGAPTLAVDRVILTGGGWQTPGLAEAFSDALGAPVAVFPSEPAPAAPALGTAIGLALQGLGLAKGANLLAAAAASAKKEARRWLSSAVAAVLLLTALGLGTWRYWALEQQSLARQAARAAATGREAEMKGLEAKERLLQKRLAELDATLHPRHRVLSALKDMSLAAPPGVWLTSVSYSSGRPVAVQGKAASPEDVTAIIEALGERGSLDYVRESEQGVDFAITMEAGEGE